MTTPSKDISKYDLTDETSAVSPAYAGGLFGALMASRGDGKLPKIYEYDTPGTYSVTVPEGVNAMLVLEACGGGGAGTTPNSDVYSGYGGNSGEGMVNKIIPVTPSSVLNIVIGIGGKTDKANGTSTTFAGTTLAGGHSNRQPPTKLTEQGFRAASGTSAKGFSSSTSGIATIGHSHFAGTGCLGANGLIGLGGYAGNTYEFQTNAGDGYRGGGGGGGAIVGGRVTSSFGKGGDGYLCFMFVNYDFDMSHGGGYSVVAGYYCSHGLAVLSIENMADMREAA